MFKPESCVETPAAPEWLSKLESRREKLTKSKLGHESGAGAPCNVCGSKCPGLDLHFWRKVCRNCKCRKDQHMCIDDDSGWAQFEILGQIRSKPAYMKIKALADQPVKLEWIPPNTTPDVVSDYMDKLGSTQIPVAGSDAAAKRKQQLEFQVPPHDLDATLCDNLTESETAQLQQYVKKVRENCVGQGNVVRVGNVQHGIVGNIGVQSVENIESCCAVKCPPPEILKKLNATPSQVVNDKVAVVLLSSENLMSAILCEPPQQLPNTIIAFQRPLTPDFDDCSLLSASIKAKLNEMKVNKDVAKSLVENGSLYDNILDNLQRKHIDFSQDPVLPSIQKFRAEYLGNDSFRNDIDKMVAEMNRAQPMYATPIKSRSNDQELFNSPLPLKNPVQTRIGSLMRQDTPMRKVKFGGVNIAYDLGLPADVVIERDPLFSNIINSEALQNALRNPSKLLSKNVVISSEPMEPDFPSSDNLSLPVRRKLEMIGVNKQAVQSGVVNGPTYDRLFSNLKDHGINYSDCKILTPIEMFRDEYAENMPFQKEISKYVETFPNNISICYSEPLQGQYYQPQSISPEHAIQTTKPGFLSNPQSPFKSGMQASKSSDSGFESKPPTPNFSTFPGISSTVPGQQEEADDPSLLGIGANAGKLSSIPGLDDFNMYPHVKPTKYAQPVENIHKGLEDLQISGDTSTSGVQSVPVIKCRECGNDIMSGEVAVKAERAGREVAWHPQCFVCHKCRELLADLVYFFHGGNVYCGRDLALILKIPRCNACDELIFTKEYTAAEGATFHIKHFCCYQCDTPLAGQQYVPDEKTNMPLCLRCYDEFYAERCQFCKHIIGPAEQGVAWGKVHWHGECFMCAGIGCGKSLIGGRFCVKNNMPFCSPQCVKSVIN